VAPVASQPGPVGRVQAGRRFPSLQFLTVIAYPPRCDVDRPLPATTRRGREMAWSNARAKS